MFWVGSHFWSLGWARDKSKLNSLNPVLSVVANKLVGMNCKNCGETVPNDELNCQACGSIAAKTKADLQKTDPAMTKAIAWALIAMGVFGLAFVISNSWTDWYSGLDYVGPIGLLVLGGVVFFTAARK